MFWKLWGNFCYSLYFFEYKRLILCSSRCNALMSLQMLGGISDAGTECVPF